VGNRNATAQILLASSKKLAEEIATLFATVKSGKEDDIRAAVARFFLASPRIALRDNLQNELTVAVTIHRTQGGRREQGVHGQCQGLHLSHSEPGLAASAPQGTQALHSLQYSYHISFLFLLSFCASGCQRHWLERGAASQWFGHVGQHA
jgi:hypothetical protein